MVEPTNDTRLPVTKSLNHSMFYADDAISIRARRTLDLAFLRQENSIKKITDPDDNTGLEYDFDHVVYEVARATVPVSVAIGLAMDILLEVAPTGVLRIDAVEEDLKKVISLARQAEQKGVQE